MRIALKSKHQRLILKCYPPGKNVDKKPNPSELSYLLYYATTRRTKLLKVGVFLEKKVINDFNHNRTGNLLVSMDIINGLIEKCSDNLDAFAINLLVIFKHILMTKDLALCQYLLPIFSKFCTEIKSDVFNGDLDFINKFEDVCQMFLGYGYKPIAPNQNEWTILSLRSIQSFSPTLAYNNGLTEVLVKLSMSLILNNLYEIDKPNLDSHLAPDGTNELRKLATIKHVTTVASHPQDNQEPEMNTVEVVAYKSLNSLFDTTTNSTGNQLQNSSIALIDYMIAKNVSENWATRMIQLSVTWIPVSSRFRFLDSLFRRLTTAKDRKQKLTLTRQVSGLLSSNVTLISLDVPGTLKLLSREQLSLVTDDVSSIHDDLIYSYTNCIQSLTSHLYYRNQVSDIISGLLKECAELFDRHALEGKYKNCVLVLFSDVESLLTKPYHESNESLSLDIWEDTFSFLLTDDEILVTRYSHLLARFLTLEVKNPEALQKPNFSKYITNQFSPISQLFQYINDAFQTSNSIGAINLNELISIMIHMIQRYGINTVANGLAFFFQWQFKDLNNVKQMDKLQDTFAFIFLYESVKYLKLDSLQTQILEKIKFRENNQLIFNTNYQFDTSKVQQLNDDPFVTKEAILSQISNESLLLSWLDLDAKLPTRDDHMSLLNSSLSKQSSMIQVNNNNNNNNNGNNTILRHTNGDLDHDRTIHSVTTSPSITTPITSNLNNLEQNSISGFLNRSFTPTPSFQLKNAPRVIDLKHVISGNNLRMTSFGNSSSIRDGGFASSVVSSRIMDDVGSLLAELDIGGELSSDEDDNYSKGRLVR